MHLGRQREDGGELRRRLRRAVLPVHRDVGQRTRRAAGDRRDPVLVVGPRVDLREAGPLGRGAAADVPDPEAVLTLGPGERVSRGDTADRGHEGRVVPGRDGPGGGRVVAESGRGGEVLRGPAVAGRVDDRDTRRGGRELARILRVDLGRAVAVVAFVAAIADRDDVGQLVRTEVLERLHHLGRSDLARPIIGDLGIGRRRRDDDLGVGGEQVDGLDVEGQLTAPGRARAVVAQRLHAGRAGRRQWPARVHRRDRGVGQPDFGVERVQGGLDAGQIPAFDDRHRGAAAVDALIPQRFDVERLQITQVEVAPGGLAGRDLGGNLGLGRLQRREASRRRRDRGRRGRGNG